MAESNAYDPRTRRHGAGDATDSTAEVSGPVEAALARLWWDVLGRPMVNAPQRGTVGTRGIKTAGRPHKKKTEDRPLTQKEAVLRRELESVRAERAPAPVFRNGGEPTPGSIGALLVGLTRVKPGQTATELTLEVQNSKPLLDLGRVTTELLALVHKNQLRRERQSEAWKYFPSAAA